MNYYNEFDPKAAAWLRELIAAGLIPPGRVDERSITEVKPEDLAGYQQCHFFAGIGGWSLALALAKWPESVEVWTGSPPCQPFSCAGRRKGQDDERHLWPAFFELIKARRPQYVIGEQVAAAIGQGWLDGVCVDLEAEGYTTGAAVLPACGVGAPHKRERLYWCGVLGHAEQSGFGRRGKRGLGTPGREVGESQDGPRVADEPCDRCDSPDRVENASRIGRRGRGDGDTAGDGGALQTQGHGGTGELGNAQAYGRQEDDVQPLHRGRFDRESQSGTTRPDTTRPTVADAPHGDGRGGKCGAQAGVGQDGIGRRRLAGSSADRSPVADNLRDRGKAGLSGPQPGQEGNAGELDHGRGERAGQLADTERGGRLGAAAHDREHAAPGRPERDATLDKRESGEGRGDEGGRANPWADSILWPCRDGKARRIPAEPALFPLADGVPGRVGLLRGAGNAIVPQVAAQFVAALMEECDLAHNH